MGKFWFLAPLVFVAGIGNVRAFSRRNSFLKHYDVDLARILKHNDEK